MIKLLLISNKKQNENYFFGLKESLEIEVIRSDYSDIFSFKDIYTSDQNIILFDITNYSIFKESLESFRLRVNGPIILGADLLNIDESSYFELKKLLKFDPLIKGIVDFSKSEELSYPLFRLLMQKFSSINKDELVDISKSLKDFENFSSRELERIKVIHEKLVPLRVDKLGGVEITSKFAAGDNAGGDFFDVFSFGTSMFVFLCKTNSYVVSNIAMAHFENFSNKANVQLEDVKEFLAGIYFDIASKKMSDERKNIEVFSGILDTNNLQFVGHNFGGSDTLMPDKILIPSNNMILSDAFFNQCAFDIQLRPGDRSMIISSGVRSNSDGKLDGTSYIDYIKKSFDNEPRNAFNDIFYQLKKDKKGIFLDYDTTLIHVEVSKNVLYKI